MHIMSDFDILKLLLSRMSSTSSIPSRRGIGIVIFRISV